MIEASREQTDKDIPTLILGESLTISSVAELSKSLIPYMEEKAGVAIDASEIKQVDTAGLQLLFAFVSSSTNRGCQVLWTGVSDTLQEVVQLLDLEAGLGIGHEH